MSTAAVSNAREVKEVVVQDDSKYLGSNLPVTQADLTALTEQRRMLREFVAKQLTKEVDYGVIPGTPKPSLYKPGAEKLNRLFGLGARFLLVEKEVDRRENYAAYTYKCEIYHLKTGNVIAECEALCNSQEKKYKERNVWKYVNPGDKKKTQVLEPTPISDIQNTLMKMAQKRAMVGATILACGASDFFTQDLEDMDENSIGQPVEDGNKTPEQLREEKINGLVANLKKIGVGEKMIRDKYKLESKPLSALTDDQCRELSDIGGKIHRKETTVKDQFPIVNFADGIGKGAAT